MCWQPVLARLAKADALTLPYVQMSKQLRLSPHGPFPQGLSPHAPVPRPAHGDARLQGLAALAPEEFAPLYHQITETLTRQIHSGRWRSNDELPSEAGL